MTLFFQIIRSFRWLLPVLLLPVGVWAAVPDTGTGGLHRPPAAVVGDSDNDGVADDTDLCPNTPAGTPVNAYGCPKTVATCDYTTASITLKSSGGSGGGTVRYVLADSLGLIRQISTTPTFAGLTGSHTYMALAVTYNGTATGLTTGQPLNSVSANCLDWSAAQLLKVCIPPPAPTDLDGDGVPDKDDLCPGTPAGTSVNAYGCPKTLTTCDYTTGSITLNSNGGSGSGTLRYVLADSLGVIQQVSPTPTFAGLTGSRTYMALAISYDGTVTGLTAGQPLSGVSAGCFDWSDAVMLKVCVPVSSACDYTIGTPIILTSTGGSSSAGSLTRYLLVDARGTIVRVGTSPSFASAGLPEGSYAAYSVVYTDDQSLKNMETGRLLSNVQANCLALSAPLPLKLCADCGIAKCIPIIVRRTR